jgi:hypothetical protein
VALLIVAKDNLAKMTEKNHHIRTEVTPAPALAPALALALTPEP